jgi:curved DNA-binding protein CbpA
MISLRRAFCQAASHPEDCYRVLGLSPGASLE